MESKGSLQYASPLTSLQAGKIPPYLQILTYICMEKSTQLISTYPALYQISCLYVFIYTTMCACTYMSAYYSFNKNLLGTYNLPITRTVYTPHTEQ